MLKRPSRKHNTINSEKLIKKRILFLYSILSIILVASFLILSIHQNNNIDQQAFYKEARNIQYSFETFLKSLEHDLTLLNDKIPATTQCQKITPLLQAFSFNHPQISAITINNEHIHCTSTPELPESPHIMQHTQISGPEHSSLLSEKYYILHYSLKNYTYEAYILASVLNKTLQPTHALIGKILVYNPQQSTPIIRISNADISVSESHKKNLKWQQMIELPIATKQNLRLQIYNNPSQSFRTFWLYEVLQLIILLSLIALLYVPLHLLIKYRYSLIGSIRQALQNGQFFPIYQPLFDWRNNSFMAVEVLLRWRDKKDNIIMPNIFIEAAEKSGLIEPITQILIKKSFKELKNWLQKNPNRHLAFNISKSHLNDTGLFEFLKSQCQKYAIHPEQIMLELTEREIIDGQNELVIQRLQALRSEGFSLAIDDFGTGHASFQYLNHLPVNYLKIDMMYVEAIGTDSMPATLIEPIIILAKKLKLGIIAEGVETEEQARYLQDHEVDLLQGWYYAKPMSADELMRLDSKPH